MAEKLKSISRQIHWSLVLRAAVFALSWFFFPFWLFFLIALYLYFIPFFQGNKLAVPFFILLLLIFIEPKSWIFVLIFGALFYYLVLIKDLLLIDRRSAYELMVLVLAFFLIRDFYEHLGGDLGDASLWYAFLVAIVLGTLIGSFMKTFAEDSPKKTLQREMRRSAAWLSFLVIWQLLLAGLFLPLDFVYQLVVVFIAVVLVIDLVPDYCLHGISRPKIFAAATTVFALLVVILTSAKWGV